VQKSAGKVLASIFWGGDQDGILLIELSSKGPNYRRGALLICDGLVSVACFLPGRAKELRAPRYINCDEFLVMKYEQINAKWNGFPYV
jgi:hypothetical protein